MEKETIYVAAAIIFNKKDGSILAAQRGYGEFKGKWEFPGGKIKDDETSEEALRREIKEELNADIEVAQKYRTIKHKYPNFNLVMYVYRCTLKNDINFVYHDKDHLEHENLIWLDLEDLDKLDWLPADIKVISELKESYSLDLDMDLPKYTKKYDLPTKSELREYYKDDIDEDYFLNGVEEDETIIRHR